jgi:hypothetical protein
LLLVIGTVPGWQETAAGQIPAPAQADTAALRIVVLEGEDGVNIIKKKTAVRPVVEVRDRNNSPVAGAAVTFLLPNFGPTGNFAQGGKVFTTVTDATGRATASSFQPSGAGTFQINVSASYQGQRGTTTISQTNFMTAAAAAAGGAAGAGAGTGGGISAATIGIIVGVAAAAAVGVAVGVSRGGGNTPASAAAPAPVPTATIGGVSGGPVFSGPR